MKLFTAGYEGSAQYEFCRRIKKGGARRVVDVRSRPFSRNPDWHMKNLRAACEFHELEYEWLGRQLGGFGKQDLSYLDLLQDGDCLVCMEENPNECHRKALAERMEVRGFAITHLRRRKQGEVRRRDKKGNSGTATDDSQGILF